MSTVRLAPIPPRWHGPGYEHAEAAQSAYRTRSKYKPATCGLCSDAPRFWGSYCRRCAALWSI